MKYAIIDKTTNLVLNVVLSDDEFNIILNENEFAVPATRSTKIGISYDPISKTFPSIVELDETLDFQDKINSLISEVTPLPAHIFNKEDDLKLFMDYLDTINEIRSKPPSEGNLELENIIKPDLNLLIPPPEEEISAEN